MVGFGDVALILALLSGVYAIFIGFRGIKSQDEGQIRNSRRATSASTLFVFGATLILVAAFLSNDFRFSYVVRNSERRLPLIYKISALWAGQAGSLLLWLLLLSLIAVIVQRQKKYREDNLDIKTVTIINVIRILFLVLLLFVTRPFEKTAALPGDGFGLNPMLQSLGMIIHPPLLFMGFSGFIVPFGFVVVEFLERKKIGKWFHFSRPWVLFSWAMLTVGIITGGQWAYNELGWGGYWAWDPVENASLFPWLTATALLHCLRLPARKKSTKIWSFSLIMLTFLLTIFGTFLTRSGVLDSVHAFASGAVGYFFLAILAVLALFSLYLGLSRFALFSEEGEIKSDTYWFSKNGGILIGSVLLNLIFCGVFFGTMFPLFSRWFWGREMVLAESFFNGLAVPLFLPLFLIMALSPLVGWKRTDWRSFGKRIWFPFVGGLAIFACVFKITQGHFLGSFSFALAALGVITHLQDLLRQCNKRKLGAFLAHMGILIMLVGVTGSVLFTEDVFETVTPGDSVTIGDYKLTYPGLTTQWGINKYSVGTTLQVFKGEKKVGVITSRKVFHQNRTQPATKVGIFSTFKKDLYLNLAGWQSQTAQLHLQTFGLVLWIWLGSGLIYLGVAVIMLPWQGLWGRVKHARTAKSTKDS